MRHKLYYKKPAEQWHDALPVGNGRIGGMICGIPAAEVISLNEDSIWSGRYRDRNNPKALAALPQIRKLIDEEKTAAAEELCADSFYGTNEQERHYQPLGDLHIYQDADDISAYSHILDLSTGVDTVTFSANGTTITRTVFVSAPSQVMVIGFHSSVRGKLDFTALIDGRDDNYDRNCAYDDSTLLFTVSDGIPFSCAVHIKGDGECRTDANRLICKNATDAMLVIGAQTAFRTADHEFAAVSDAKSAARLGFEKLLSLHIADHAALFSRSDLCIADDTDDMPTDERLSALKDGDSSQLPILCELYFDYAKYLMIAGSRTGTLPLNLQGIWNKDMWPAWGSKYTVNINTEMNYWAAEIQNLSECHIPLFDHIERMREHGRVTARRMYGCRGAVCHHNTDIWGDTAPQDKWLPATLWPMGLAWLCTHIWEHYLFTQDKAFLEEKFDTMLESAEFFLDFLIEDENGCLVTSPSVSPENSYFTQNGDKGTLCKAPSMDSQILETLFSAVIKAADIIGDTGHSELISQISAAKARLPKPAVGKHGQICEWASDYDEPEPGHRHISQLYGLYPSDIIKYSDKRLSDAARATLDRRLSHGGGHTGWSRAWIINMWARLHDSAKVEENLTALLTRSTADSLLDMHPPFQIDGNFGGGAGICESLIQSIDDTVEFLPALPPSWKSGSFRGLRARGGFEASLEWADSQPVKAVIISTAGNPLNIRSDKPVTVNGREYAPLDGIITCETAAGESYEILFRS